MRERVPRRNPRDFDGKEYPLVDETLVTKRNKFDGLLESFKIFYQEHLAIRVKTAKISVPHIQLKELHLMTFQETNDEFIEKQSDTEEKEDISYDKTNEMDADL